MKQERISAAVCVNLHTVKQADLSFLGLGLIPISADMNAACCAYVNGEI